MYRSRNQGVFHPDRTPIKNRKAMIKKSIKPEISGTRSGYVIRYTCPECLTENAIVNKSPRDHYKESRDAACKKCRKRCRIITPGIHNTA